MADSGSKNRNIKQQMKTIRLWIVALLALLTLPAAAQKRDIRLTVQVTAIEGDSLQGQQVNLWQTDYDLSYGAVTLSAEGEATVAVYAGNHRLTVSRAGYETAELRFNVTRDTTVSVTLREQVRQPFSLKTSVAHNVFTGTNSVTLTWNKEDDAFFDDFESYTPFAVKFGEWTGIDGDNMAAAPLVGDYMNRGVLQYAQVISPLHVDPVWWYDYPVLRPYSGGQYVGFTRTGSGVANDDWLISPTVTPGSDNWLEFMAKAADVYAEKFQVYVTTNTGSPAKADFTMVSPGNYETVTVEGWRKFSYDLGDYKGVPIKFAIRYIGEANNGGAFMLMVDDVRVGQDYTLSARKRMARRVVRKSPTNPYETFAVYLNGERKAVTEELDHTFDGLAAGTYTLGVKALYRSAESAMAETTVTISDKDLASVDFNVTTNNGKTANGMTIEVVDMKTNTTYSAKVREGAAAFPSLPYGNYLVGVTAANYDRYERQIAVGGDTAVSVPLEETIVTPYHITADSETKEDGTLRVRLKWNQVLCFQDSFEDYPDFATGTFGGWKTYDFDRHNTYPIGLGSATNIVTFPGASTPSAPCPVAPLVFNPWNTTPAMMPTDNAVAAPTGNKTVVFFSPQQNGADKWLVSPPIQIYDDYVARFTAKAYAQYKEVLSLGVITEDNLDGIASGNDMLSVFTQLSTVDGVSYGAWTIYETDLSAYAGQTVRIALHYTSYDAFFTQVDDFFAGIPDAEGSLVDVGDVLRYEIYLDGQKVGESEEPEFTLDNLKAGTSHKVGIVAVYASGSSPMGEYTFSTPTGLTAPTVGGAEATPRFDLLGRPVANGYRGVTVTKDRKGLWNNR